MKKLFITILLIIGVGFSADAEPVSPPKRIVSLAPSMTEIMFALGLQDHIVGLTTFCDYPEEAKKKPKIGGMSNPSLEAVLSLKPDLVVMTTDGNPREFEERLHSLKIRTYVFSARRIAELPRGIREMGAALAVPERAEALAQEIEAALAGSKTSGAKNKGINSAICKEPVLEGSNRGQSVMPKKVLFIVWPEPLLVAGPGTAIHDAFVLLDLDNAASGAQTTYPRYSIEEVIRQAPEVLFIGKASGMNMSAVSQGILKKLSSIPAVKSGSVCYVGDGLYRLGPRIVEGIKELAACVR
jgi:iron complex transport system substrate-binding protein